MTANNPDIDMDVLLGSFVAGDELTLTRHVSLEPNSWWEWQCPSCQGTFEGKGLCPQCHTELRRTQVSLPFIWIG